MAWRTTVLAAVLVAVALAPDASAQFGRGGGRGGGPGGFGGCQFGFDKDGYFVSPSFAGNPRYDGRVTFARIKYRGSYECFGMGPGWAHDYPRAEWHFTRILKEITSIRPFVDDGRIIGSAVVRLDEPELFSYPVAYLSEPGGLTLNDAELSGLRRYIERGGFVIIDDIEGEPNPDYLNLLEQWKRAFPQLKPIKLSNEHPIFRCFFNIDLSKVPPKMRGSPPPEYMAFFVDNDPAKRMLAIIDKYADVSTVIGFSDRGFSMVPAEESYKLWINYFVYALTH